jgi:uncharacterized NAD(P)/FAD-binding protein YdhS
MTTGSRNVAEMTRARLFAPAVDAGRPGTRETIGIIGGGASAVCLIDALAQSGLECGSITVFEPSDLLWRGRPYQPDVSAVRVNLAPEAMTVRFGDKDHFLRWLAARAKTTELVEPAADHVDPLSAIKFVPRAMYGEYLNDSARDALDALAGRGWRVQIIRELVRAARPDGDGLVLVTDRGREFPVERAVLCTGRGVPPDTYGLAGSPGFVADPYPLADTLAEIGPADDIAVLGSGLTGVDVVLALAAHGHRGRIHLLSRTGVLPFVRQRRMRYELRHFTPESFRDGALRGDPVGLDDLITTMRDEFDAAGEDLATIAAELVAFEHEEPVARLRRHLAAVDSPSYALRILQSAVPATGPDVWTSLPESEKADLMTRYYRALMSICCPMTAAAAATIVDLIDRGRLTITAGMRDVDTAPNGGFTITTDTQTLHADTVVNAVNNLTVRAMSPLAGALIASLVARGLAQWHHYGGVHVDRATSRLLINGRTDPRLYALGDLAGGSLLFTFGMPSLVDRAHDIVEDLLHGGLSARRAVVAERLHAARRLDRLPSRVNHA